MMFEYSWLLRTVLLYSWSSVLGFGNSIPLSGFQKYPSVSQIYGDLIEKTGVKTSRECILHCLRQPDCRGAVFNPNTAGTTQCLVAGPGVNIINIAGYDYYNVKRCADRSTANYDFLLDAGLPCPRLYFPLDDDIGTKLGSSPWNVQFVSGGKVGGAFFNPANSSVRSFYNLGYYPSSDFCFPLAERCPLGITVAFWLKILGDSGNTQGILTTTGQVSLYTST